ncbi:hypothetical protein V8G54_006760 [Vigna mungo]|uniref:Uncharacterized protein n=1 Tax=Vigna mungo TaxID=3915 RepID=A0AAQ3P128_VIGMU
MDKCWRDSQGENIDASTSISLIPLHFRRVRYFNVVLMFERAPIIPNWVMLLHSSNCRLSRDLAALLNATKPLSDTKQHLRRNICFRWMQPLPMASMLASVIPRHEETVSDISFCRP